ncbi:hypothetical protein NMD1_01321 [Novosphingobium sp. MD-1]|nr:hypothetical protein NMD1_01321 [Novosphingobium sp. MD-1]
MHDAPAIRPRPATRQPTIRPSPGHESPANRGRSGIVVRILCGVIGAIALACARRPD